MAAEKKKVDVKQRKKWIEPKIETVSLVPKETVMGACFSASLTHGSEQEGGCGIPFPKCRT